MINIITEIKVIVEGVAAQKSDAVAKAKEHGFTRGLVGSGYGKFAGNLMGAPIPGAGVVGATAGHYIGKNAIKDPEKSADLTKKSHRFGIGMHHVLKPRHLLTAIASGAAAAVGAHAAGHDPATAAKIGIAAGTAGAGFHQMGSSYAINRKMGYGKVGRFGGALASLTTPKSQRDALKQ